MTNEELVTAVLEKVGQRDNVIFITNCMTRLRINVKDDAAIDEAGLKAIEGVMGVVHDRPSYVEVVVGPGKVRKCADVCAEMGIPTTGTATTENSWKANKEAVKANQKSNPVRNALKIFGEIFVPLIPGVIAAGICAGLNTLIQQLNPGWADNQFLSVLCSFLGLINTSFMTYLTAWAGYRAAERFGGTPILGGMLGLITGLEGINTISQTIGWFNADSPLNSILRSGRGGVLAAVLGVLIMVKVEKFIRSKMPEALDIVFTPILTLIFCIIPYIFIVMPVCGLVSSGLCAVVQYFCMSSSAVVRIIAGYISAALFLPMVAMGMHHGLVALYTVQLNQIGYVTLYPALCMAGAGQVGAAIAIYRKAKKLQNDRLASVISGALPAGILGVGEPLIYGVTLPMGRPFITAGLGAGFGGAFVMAMQVAATTWGPSGILGCFVMTAGPHGGLMSVLYYAIGLVISAIAAYLITNAVVKNEDVANA